MFLRLQSFCKQHLRDNLLLYILIVITLIIGITVGSLAVKLLTVEETVELTQYLSAYLGGMERVEINYLIILKESLFNNLKTLVFIWFLGLTVLGLPLIFVLLLSKGFILGFTAGFLIQEQGWQGMVLNILTLALPNFLILPALIFASVLGVTFSIWLVKGRRQFNNLGFGQQLLAYSTAILLSSLFIIAGGVLEAYGSSYLIKLAFTFFNA
ncbi:MAG: stage II sporulation protein M [Bacillota bacterium]